MPRRLIKRGARKVASYAVKQVRVQLGMPKRLELLLSDMPRRQKLAL